MINMSRKPDISLNFSFRTVAQVKKIEFRKPIGAPMTTDNSTILDNYPPVGTGKYQVLGWMPADEYAALLRSIQSQGQVQVPIIKDANGNTLDGHHRELAHKQLKIKEVMKVQTIGIMSEGEKRHYALSVNLVRRQISRKQRRELIAEELRRTPDLSNSAIAEVCGTTKKTVKSVRDDLVAKGEIPQFERLRRKNGGHYPVTTIVTTDKRSADRAQKALKELADDAPTQTLTLENATWLLRDKRRKEIAARPLPTIVSDDVIIEHTDLRKQTIKDGSVDLLLTDPPYGKDSLPLWSDLAVKAKSCLKPGGLLVAYSGVSTLPEVFRRLSDHLEYVWTLSIVLAKGRTFIRKIQGRCRWRPVLLFCNGTYNPTRSFVDSSFGICKEKELHEWQQGISEARRLIDKFSEPRDLVYDPFGGSFTNALAAFERGRRFIGCDIEEQNVRLGKHRLADAIKEAQDLKPAAARITAATELDSKSA